MPEWITRPSTVTLRVARPFRSDALIGPWGGARLAISRISDTLTGCDRGLAPPVHFSPPQREDPSR